MKITSAEFIKGLVGEDDRLSDGKAQVALIGRSNVGKSSVINALANNKTLARTSNSPGRTREINLFLLNNALYLLDLPGYGYAKASWEVRQQLLDRIDWYLFQSPYQQKAVFQIIDAEVGPTDKDLEMLECLEEKHKTVVIVANKTDKIKKSKYEARLAEIRNLVGDHRVIPFSAKKKIGISELTEVILN